MVRACAADITARAEHAPFLVDGRQSRRRPSRRLVARKGDAFVAETRAERRSGIQRKGAKTQRRKKDEEIRIPTCIDPLVFLRLCVFAPLR
jgi:hypothetical protein